MIFLTGDVDFVRLYVSMLFVVTCWLLNPLVLVLHQNIDMPTGQIVYIFDIGVGTSDGTSS